MFPTRFVSPSDFGALAANSAKQAFEADFDGLGDRRSGVSRRAPAGARLSTSDEFRRATASLRRMRATPSYSAVRNGAADSDDPAGHHFCQ
ncbi:hypothetical protein GCM10023196_043770 [Actinoallomurus vinaceus]|uniref:Uncharacterized protein n=1 Tax=Actinoallomurus vinaceus TaxID=1080074 RepID=A0ABP8UBA6_9ACTN